MYRDGLAVVGEAIEHFVFLAVEKTAPYGIGIFSRTSGPSRRVATRSTKDLRSLAEAIETDRWPAYTTGIQPLSLPDWST